MFTARANDENSCLLAVYLAQNNIKQSFFYSEQLSHQEACLVLH